MLKNQRVKNEVLKYVGKLINEENQNIGETKDQDDKNKGTQLDGVLRDILSWWENVKYQNSVDREKMWLNS